MQPQFGTCGVNQWIWTPRTGAIKWDLFEAVDVVDIARRGDVGSVGFYLQSLLYANVTRPDAERFGSKAAMNMFMIMQLAIEYMTAHAGDSAALALFAQQYQHVQTAAACQVQYEQTVAEAHQQILSREASIARLKQRCGQLDKELTKSKSVIRKLRKTVAKERARKESEQTGTDDDEPQRRRLKEPGLIERGAEVWNFEKRNTGRDDHRTEEEDLSEGEIDVANVMDQMFGKRTSK